MAAPSGSGIPVIDGINSAVQGILFERHAAKRPPDTPEINAGGLASGLLSLIRLR